MFLKRVLLFFLLFFNLKVTRKKSNQTKIIALTKKLLHEKKEKSKLFFSLKKYMKGRKKKNVD